MTDSKNAAHGGHGCCGGHARHAHGEGMNTAVKDPVCGMTVDPAKTPHHAVHQHHDYHFCSAGCLAKFEADPAHYLAEYALAPHADAFMERPPATGRARLQPDVRSA